MKIAFPVERTTLDSHVSPSFGRAPFFLVVDTGSGDFEAITNDAANAPGGAGIRAAQTIVDSGAKALVTFRCGQNAADVLKPAQIQLLTAQSGTVGEHLELFKAGKLTELTQIHAGFHGRGRS